jgi:hypothetical protein
LDVINEDDAAAWVARYRALVEDVATPALDRAIIAAASRRAAQRRVLRRGGGAFVVVAICMLGVVATWYSHPAKVDHPTDSEANDGALEGLTRAYLLDVGTQQYFGPGATEEPR